MVVILLLVGSAAVFINKYWSPIVSEKLKEIVKNSTDGLYRINFKEAKLQIINGRITITNITLTVDSAVYRKMKLAHIAPNNLYSLRVKKLVINRNPSIQSLF